MIEFYMHKDTATLIKEIPYCDPIAIFAGLHHKKWAILFDSAVHDSDYGRFSYIAIEPFSVLWAKNGQINIDDILVSSHKNPFQLLNDTLATMPQATLAYLPPFQGGAAGAFSYDLYQYIETIPAHRFDDTYFPDMAIGFYDMVLSFDHQQKKAWIISTGKPELTFPARLSRATKRLDYFSHLIQQATKISPAASTVMPKDESCLPPAITSNFTKTTYTDAVKKVINYISAGDIFEASISQRFESELPSGVCPFDLYKRLRKTNPAPFAAFINLGDTYVISASPERFLQLIDNEVETRPIKGTRPRSADPIVDRQLAEELKACEKDLAENIMIVDLLRNDLSKVCNDHSVQVTQLCGLESYSTVHHLVSVITGTLKANKTAVDLLVAAFPGGSITGAPKVRAMQIIAEIEPSKRGIYCGSLGFIGFNGTMDTSIVIRTYTLRENKISFQAGGAIVIDSNPDNEYQETLTKSSAVRNALGSQ